MPLVYGVPELVLQGPLIHAAAIMQSITSPSTFIVEQQHKIRPTTARLC